MNSENYSSPAPFDAEAYDSGLRSYLQKVYYYMTTALAMTGVIAFYSVQSNSFLNMMYIMQGNTVVALTPLAWMVALAPLALAFLLGFGLMRLSLAVVQISFWAYSVLIGLSLSIVILGFSGESIARAIFIAAGTFAAAGLYGYTTKLSMTNMGSFMMMGLIGLIIATLVNVFLQSAGMQFILSIIGVIFFTGLTAYDTQHLKKLYGQFSESEEEKEK